MFYPLLDGALNRLSKGLVGTVMPVPRLAAVAACKNPLPSPMLPFSRQGQYNCLRDLNTCQTTTSFSMAALWSHHLSFRTMSDSAF